MSWILPNEYLESVLSIDLDSLHAMGKTTLLVDLDNTLLPRTTEIVPPELIAWVDAAKGKGFKFCLVSNNWHDRVTNVAAQLDVKLVCKAIKPLPPAFLIALHRLGSRRGETVVIGDQLFTDTLGGRLLGMYTIMVLPQATYDLPHTLFLRKVERIFMGDMRPTR